VAIAKDAGFSITQAELLRRQAGLLQELSDEELEEAAGGTLMTLLYCTGTHYNCPQQSP